MAKVGKKYADSAKLIDKSKMYDPAEALELVCQCKFQQRFYCFPSIR